MKKPFDKDRINSINENEVWVFSWFLENKVNKWWIIFLHIRNIKWELKQIVVSNIDEIEKAKSITKWSYITLSWEEINNLDIKNPEFNNKEIKMEKIINIVNASLWRTLDINSMEATSKERILQLRNPKYRLIMEIWSDIKWSFQNFFRKHNFIEINTPKIIWTASEWWAEVFPVEFYWEKAYLAQSPQFGKQSAMAAWLWKVFEIAPAFRADPSKTSRHLAEFMSVDMEMSDITSHEDLMEFQEKLLVETFKEIIEKYWVKIKQYYTESELNMPPSIFPKIPLLEAKRILEKKYNHHISNDSDIDPEWEKLIAKYVKDEFNSDFVYLTDYQSEYRPFYHMCDSETGLTKSFDLLYKGVEISTWSQREHRYDTLVHQAHNSKKKASVSQITEYLNSFRYWMPAHWWFGLWLDRLVQQILWLQNVKQVPFNYVAKGHIPY